MEEFSTSETSTGREEFAGGTAVYTTSVIGDPLPAAGNVINETTAMTIPAFYSGVRFLAETLAGLPKHVYRKAGDIRQRDNGHRLDPILNDAPNDLTTAFVLWETLYAHALTYGNGYGLIERDAAGRAAAVYNMVPDRVIPFRADGRQWYAVEVEAGRYRPVQGEAILHVPGLGFDGMKGYPVVRLMEQALRIGKAAEGFGARFFEKGATLGGAIETEKVLTAEQLDTLRQSIRDNHTGIDNAHAWMVLMAGAKAHPFTVPPEQAQFLETRQFSVLDVARTLRVPPHILYDYGRATWGNIEHMGIEVVQYSLAAWTIKSEQEINRKLFTQAERQAGYYVKFNVDALQRGDHAQQIESARKRLEAGLTSINEERALMELPPIGPEGDVHRVPANLQAASALADPPTPTPTPTPPAKQEQARQPVSLTTFGELIGDAARRVEVKTLRATDTARNKFQNDRDGWVRWGNVFAEEQADYAAAAVAPILTTAAKLGGIAGDVDALAARIGQRYAAALRGHYSRTTAGQDSTPPDLAAITVDTATKGDNGEGTTDDPGE